MKKDVYDVFAVFINPLSPWVVKSLVTLSPSTRQPFHFLIEQVRAFICYTCVFC